MANRGRFQAQGSKLEESESWNTEKSFNKSNARKLLKSLKCKLKQKDLDLRINEFSQVESYINNAPSKYGVSAQVHKTFRVKSTRSERVDIEVIKGAAFEE
ncbi:hypothetical protein [Marinomonas fungiae]|uniref:hypothetical protein n=1 Tax=Marinomonas fungiae TaxID=1137284 RepID=UPI003A90EA99